MIYDDFTAWKVHWNHWMLIWNVCDQLSCSHCDDGGGGGNEDFPGFDCVPQWSSGQGSQGS